MRSLITLFGSVILCGQASGQFDQTAFFHSSNEDVAYLGEEYLRPLGQTMIYGLNNGWYETAKVRKIGRISLMLTPTFIQIPVAEKSFTIDNRRLSSLELMEGSRSVSPTIFGSSESPYLKFKNSNHRFRAPSGADTDWLVLPMATASLGLVLNTEVYFRYLPETRLPGGKGTSVSMRGLAVKHDLIQWIPLLEDLPIAFSGFFGYTNLEWSRELNEPGQRIEMNTRAYTLRGLISAEIGMITPYVGLGVNFGQSDLWVRGDYKYSYETVPGDPSTKTTELLTDPVSVLRSNEQGLVANAGVRLKLLGIIATSLDYSFGRYKAITAGVGISLDF